MKKINKSQPPNALTEYETQNTNNNWDEFRSNNTDGSYKAIKKLLLQDQGGLCGYCEAKLSILPEHKQRVEHFHSKSDCSNPAKNWALDWQNVFAVCIGGSDADKSMHPLPINLSCDAYKDHLITSRKLNIACESDLLNPLNVLATPSLFIFDKSNGELKVNQIDCENIKSLVDKTIKILNLNCQRLCADRLEVLKSYNQEVAKSRKRNDRQGLAKLADRWFKNNRWPSYFTTRRLLLGCHAEACLIQINYDG